MGSKEDIARIKKGIQFLRGFNTLKDVELYRKAVLRFLDLTENFINGGKKQKTSIQSAIEVGLINEEDAA